MGVMPFPETAAKPDVGGIVGHMLEHQVAIEDLVQGLVLPSDTHWQRGIERLRSAPLQTGDLPADRRLSQQVRQAETEVHRIVDRAASAATDIERADAYARLLTTCAECHSLHRAIWGPTPKQ
jgi:hypothetical protein